MLKANELRIGNYFKPDSFDRAENAYEIITAKDIIELESDPQDDFYQPLKLTEEWLIKFEPQIKIDSIGYYTFYKQNELTSYGLGLYAEDFCLTYDGYVTKETYIKYVHQLQNLYWCLVGEELEYVNNP